MNPASSIIIVECARLQCLDSLNELPSSKTRAFKAPGNAVNVDVIAVVAEKLIDQGLESRDLNEAMRLSALRGDNGTKD